ncbi:hypothetical protein Mapa_001612 [Marchantia paleacea]|nr:hypothetical protein Mapa_001612 [Marchantia paleacea]
MQLPHKILVFGVFFELVHRTREKSSRNHQKKQCRSSQEPLKCHMISSLVEEIAHKDAATGTSNSSKRVSRSRTFKAYASQEDDCLHTFTNDNCEGNQEECILASFALQLTSGLLFHGIYRNLRKLLLPLGSPCVNSNHRKCHKSDEYHRYHAQNSLPQGLGTIPGILRHRIIKRQKDSRSHQ